MESLRHYKNPTVEAAQRGALEAPPGCWQQGSLLSRCLKCGVNPETAEDTKGSLPGKQRCEECGVVKGRLCDRCRQEFYRSYTKCSGRALPDNSNKTPTAFCGTCIYPLTPQNDTPFCIWCNWCKEHEALRQVLQDLAGIASHHVHVPVADGVKGHAYAEPLDAEATNRKCCCGRALPQGYPTVLKKVDKTDFKCRGCSSTDAHNNRESLCQKCFRCIKNICLDVRQLCSGNSTYCKFAEELPDRLGIKLTEVSKKKAASARHLLDKLDQFEPLPLLSGGGLAAAGILPQPSSRQGPESGIAQMHMHGTQQADNRPAGCRGTLRDPSSGEGHTAGQRDRHFQQPDCHERQGEQTAAFMAYRDYCEDQHGFQTGTPAEQQGYDPDVPAAGVGMASNGTASEPRTPKRGRQQLPDPGTAFGVEYGKAHAAAQRFDADSLSLEKSLATWYLGFLDKLWWSGDWPESQRPPSMDTHLLTKIWGLDQPLGRGGLHNIRGLQSVQGDYVIRLDNNCYTDDSFSTSDLAHSYRAADILGYGPVSVAPVTCDGKLLLDADKNAIAEKLDKAQRNGNICVATVHYRALPVVSTMKKLLKAGAGSSELFYGVALQAVTEIKELFDSGIWLLDIKELNVLIRNMHIPEKLETWNSLKSTMDNIKVELCDLDSAVQLQSEGGYNFEPTSYTAARQGGDRVLGSPWKNTIALATPGQLSRSKNPFHGTEADPVKVIQWRTGMLLLGLLMCRRYTEDKGGFAYDVLAAERRGDGMGAILESALKGVPAELGMLLMRLLQKHSHQRNCELHDVKAVLRAMHEKAVGQRLALENPLSPDDWRGWVGHVLGNMNVQDPSMTDLAALGHLMDAIVCDLNEEASPAICTLVWTLLSNTKCQPVELESFLEGAVDRYGRNMLHLALAAGRLSVLYTFINTLIERKMTGLLDNLLAATDKFGYTPAHLGAYLESWDALLAVLAYVQMQGPVPDWITSQDSDGLTLLHVVCRWPLDPSRRHLAARERRSLTGSHAPEVVRALNSNMPPGVMAPNPKMRKRILKDQGMEPAARFALALLSLNVDHNLWFKQTKAWHAEDPGAFLPTFGGDTPLHYLAVHSGNTGLDFLFDRKGAAGKAANASKDTRNKAGHTAEGLLAFCRPWPWPGVP